MCQQCNLFSPTFSIHGCLTPWVWNPKMWRAHYTVIRSLPPPLEVEGEKEVRFPSKKLLIDLRIFLSYFSIIPRIWPFSFPIKATLDTFNITFSLFPFLYSCPYIQFSSCCQNLLSVAVCPKTHFLYVDILGGKIRNNHNTFQYCCEQ